MCKGKPPNLIPCQIFQLYSNNNTCVNTEPFIVGMNWQGGVYRLTQRSGLVYSVEVQIHREVQLCDTTQHIHVHVYM